MKARLLTRCIRLSQLCSNRMRSISMGLKGRQRLRKVSARLVLLAGSVAVDDDRCRRTSSACAAIRKCSNESASFDAGRRFAEIQRCHGTSPWHLPNASARQLGSKEAFACEDFAAFLVDDQFVS